MRVVSGNPLELCEVKRKLNEKRILKRINAVFAKKSYTGNALLKFLSDKLERVPREYTQYYSCSFASTAKRVLLLLSHIILK